MHIAPKTNSIQLGPHAYTVAPKAHSGQRLPHAYIVTTKAHSDQQGTYTAGNSGNVSLQMRFVNIAETEATEDNNN